MARGAVGRGWAVARLNIPLGGGGREGIVGNLTSRDNDDCCMPTCLQAEP